MKTKLLLLTSVLSLVGGASLMAQTVYSQNAVGYVNVPVTANKFHLLVAPLTATTNNLNTFMTNGVTDGSYVYTFSTVNGWQPSQFIDGFGWTDDFTINAGTGFFYLAANTGTITFVGEVPQGSLTNHVNTGYNLRGSIVPQSTNLVALGYVGQDADYVYRYDSVIGWDPYQYIDGFGWTGPTVDGPVLRVAEGFFYLRDVNNGPKDFTRTFTVN